MSLRASGQAVTRCGEPTGRTPRAHPTAMGEISPGCCRAGLHPRSSPHTPGDTGSLQGDVFAYFPQDQSLGAGSAPSSTDTWPCRGLSPNSACSSACAAGSCAALGKPQHGLVPVPIPDRRYSLLFEDKPQGESGKGPVPLLALAAQSHSVPQCTETHLSPLPPHKCSHRAPRGR